VAVEVFDVSTMKITRCRYWRCPECQKLHEKKELAGLLRRHGAGEEVSVTGVCRCTKCGSASRAVDVYAGAYDVPREQWGRLPAPVEVAVEQVTAAPRRRPRARAAEPEETEWAILDEDEDVEDEEDPREKRRWYAARRRGLNTVDTGLAIHYAGMVAFLLSQVAGWVGLGVVMATAVAQAARGEEENAAAAPLAVSAMLFLASWGLSALASLSDVVSSAFCLAVPDELARKFLLASLVVRLLAAPLGLVLLILGLAGIASLVTSFLAIVGWLLWVGFLWGLADCLEYPSLGEEAVGVTLGAVYLVLTWIFVTCLLVGFLLFALVLARIANPCFFFSPLALAALIAGIIRYLLASGKFETLRTLLLYPTGIPLIMRYLDLIGTTRMIILRRS
jgi:hypothetical protein